jgi:diguanylate cyclase (GGDEF)-like protein
MLLYDELEPCVKSVLPASHTVRIVLSFIAFCLASLILLNYPMGRTVGLFQHGLLREKIQSHVYLDAAPDLVALLVCVACVMVMGRITNSLRDKPPFIFANYVLFLFLFFFAIERLIGDAVLWPQLHLPMRGLPTIEVFSSLTVAMGAAVVLPRLRGVMGGVGNAREEHARFLAAAESSLDDFYIFDGVPDASGRIVDFRFRYINPNAERRLNTRRETLLGKILTEVRPFMITSGLIEHYREVVRTGVPFTCEVFIDDEMIKATWINVQVVKLGDGIAITSRDITESRRLTDHVHYLAHHDQLTGLPNRTLLQDRLQQAILRAQRHKQRVAVFMLDVDHFKRINDSLGHAGGDALLTAVGKRLLSCVRETDTIARMGGDEFVIVMPEFKSLEDVRRCGEQIVNKMAKPITISDHEIHITVSVGLCIYPDYGLEPEQLLKNADTAMYEVKDAGRNNLHIFSESEGGGYENTF